MCGVGLLGGTRTATSTPTGGVGEYSVFDVSVIRSFTAYGPNIYFIPKFEHDSLFVIAAKREA